MDNDYQTKCADFENNFVKKNGKFEWNFEFKFLRFLIPRSVIIQKWTAFFQALSKCKSRTCLLDEIDATFDAKHRSVKAQNLAIPPENISQAVVADLKARGQIQTANE